METVKSKKDLADMYRYALDELNQVIGFRMSFGQKLREVIEKFPQLANSWKKILEKNFDDAPFDFMEYLTDEYMKNVVITKGNNVNIYGVKLVNLTDQKIYLIGDDGEVINIESSSPDKVCKVHKSEDFDFRLGCLKVTKIYNQIVVNIPHETSSTYFIVSLDVANILKNKRSDILTTREVNGLLELVMLTNGHS